MTIDELRAACERAGFIWDTRLNAWRTPSTLMRWMEDDHPALPAYVASLLAAKANLSFDVYWQTSGRYLVHLWRPDNQSGDYWGDTLAEAIIRAAMAVLGEG